jgi:cytidylate kinase
MNRSTAPLRQAEDAVVIDTSELDIPQVLEQMLAVIQETRKSGQTDQPG